MDRRLSGHLSQSGHGDEEKKSLPLSGIKSQSSSQHPSHYTELSYLLSMFNCG